MGYISVAETAKKWNVSERTIRNYCAHDKIPGAFLTGKTWNIPDSAQKQCVNLRDTCLTAQDKFKKYLDYFRIQHRY